MATFEAQVSGLTGLTDTFSGSTNPKDTELDQFLNSVVPLLQLVQLLMLLIMILFMHGLMFM